jgi:hypothetical protein
MAIYTYTRRNARNGNPRKVTLQHIRTGRIVTMPSVSAFARRMRWGTNGTFHLDNVLKGNRLHHRGWGVPAVLNEELRLKDALGNEYRETVAAIARRLGSHAANRLRRQQPFQALVPTDTDLTHVLAPSATRPVGYLFRAGYSRGRGSPLVRLDKLAEAKERLGISTSSACWLVKGYRQAIRGVTFVRAYTEPRRLTALTPVEVAS